MGANAVTTVPVYVSGEVLTASDLNITNSGIPVFATTTTRDAAFGGTGEKTLAQGQYAYIEATSTLQVYTGSAWISASNSGLAFISNTAISATASTTISNCFSSTYRHYRLLWQGTTSNDTAMLIQLRAGGTTTTTNYARQRIVASSTSVSGASGSTSGISAGAPDSTSLNFASIDIFNPQVASVTGYFSNMWGPTNGMYIEAGRQTDSTQFDSVVFTPAAGTFTGNVAIYGYTAS